MTNKVYTITLFYKTIYGSKTKQIAEYRSLKDATDFLLSIDGRIKQAYDKTDWSNPDSIYIPLPKNEGTYITITSKEDINWKEVFELLLTPDAETTRKMQMNKQ